MLHSSGFIRLDALEELSSTSALFFIFHLIFLDSLVKIQIGSFVGEVSIDKFLTIQKTDKNVNII